MTEHAAAFETYGLRQKCVLYTTHTLLHYPPCSPFRIEDVLGPHAAMTHGTNACVFRCVSYQTTPRTITHGMARTTHDTRERDMHVTKFTKSHQGHIIETET